MERKPKSEHEKELELYDRIISLQRQIIELYRKKTDKSIESANLLSEHYKSLLKQADENYKGLKITDETETY